MGRVCTIATAILFLTASWVCAGNFEVLADAGVIRPPAQLQATPGTVVKAEFKANLKSTSDMELESDSLLPEPVAAKEGAKAKPAIAFRERSKGMAPAFKATQKQDHQSIASEARGDSVDLEGDLEKDLVLEQPKPKAEEKEKAEPKATEKKSATEKPAVTEKKPEKKAAPQVKKIAPPERGSFAVGAKPIQKVKPITQNPWHVAAGSYSPKPAYTAPAERMCSVQGCPPNARNNARTASRQYNQAYEPAAPAYMNSDPRRVPMPPSADRIVRDGVTIKLAPAAAPPMEGNPYPEEESSSGSDVINAAAEILGMPFAFLSSFF